MTRRVFTVFTAFVVINQLIILPYTNLFRPYSDPSSPPVQHRLRETFGDTIELLGYDLDTATARPGQEIYLQLYWRLLKPTDQSLRAAVRVTSIDGSQSWGQVESFNLGGTNTRNWPTDQYAVDRYQLTVAPDAPPFVGHLRLAVFPFGQAIDYLKTAGGANDAILTDFRIQGDRRVVADSEIAKLDITFGGAIKLIGAAQERIASGQQCVILRWQALRAPGAEYAVMLHLQDPDGIMIAAADGPPLNGLYPTHQWSAGQILDDRHCFTGPASAVAIGLYSRDDGQRLQAVGLSGVRLDDDSVIVPLIERSQ